MSLIELQHAGWWPGPSIENPLHQKESVRSADATLVRLLAMIGPDAQHSTSNSFFINSYLLLEI